MKALRYHRFGGPEVLLLEDVKKPTIGDCELLIRVHATTVNSGDCHMRSGRPFLARVFAGPIYPRQKILGTTYSGVIVDKGREVDTYEINDQVVGTLGIHSGTYADYIVVSKEDVFIKKPEDLSHEEGVSMIFGFLSAKYFLDKAGIREGQKVLVIGAAGAVGSHGIQYAKGKGAHLYGLCHKESMDFVYELGAEKCYDYRDSLRQVEHTFDIIFDTAGKEKLSRISSLLTETGVYITTAARMDVMVKSWRRRSKGTQFIFDISKSSRASLASLMYLVERGAYRPTVDRVFPLEDGAAAHQYYETHRKRGAVVLQMK